MTPRRVSSVTNVQMMTAILEQFSNLTGVFDTDPAKKIAKSAAMSALKFQNFDDVIKYPAFSALETVKRMYLMYKTAATKDFSFQS